RHDDAPQIPGGAQIVAGVLELLVPAGGHRDAARRRQGAEPAVLLADFLRVQLKRPQTSEVEEGSMGVLLRKEGHAAQVATRRIVVCSSASFLAEGPTKISKLPGSSRGSRSVPMKPRSSLVSFSRTLPLSPGPSVIFAMPFSSSTGREMVAT